MLDTLTRLIYGMTPEAEIPLFYFCNDGVTVEGPHTWEQMLELLQMGSVSRDTHICVAGYEEWSALGAYFPTDEQSTGDLLEVVTETPDQSAVIHQIVSSEPRRPLVLTRQRWAVVAASALLVAFAGFHSVRRLATSYAAPDFAPQQAYKPGQEPNKLTTSFADSEESWVWVIKPRFEKALPFSSNGLAAVRSGGKWGLIDKTGREVLSCVYDEIKLFPKENCAAVRDGERWGLTDGQGNVVLSPSWEAVQPLVNGFIPAKKDGKWGYADASGKLVIPCVWDDAWRFSPAGTAVVTKIVGNDRKRGFIDRRGSVITKPQWDGAIAHVAEGIGAVRRDNGWALVDKHGNVLGEPQWGMQWRLLRADLGFLPVWRDGKWGILALNGKVLVEPAWDSVAPAKNGVLLSKPGTKAIFVGTGGKSLFETGPWDEIRGVKSPYEWGEMPGFSEGFLAVRSGDKWGFIDDRGKTVIAPGWSQVGDFHEGLVAVKKDNNQRESWEFLKADGSRAFAVPEGLQIGYYWKAPRFRRGMVRARRADFSEIEIDREGQFCGEQRNSEHPWLPAGVVIDGTGIDYVSRHGRYGYMRNFAGANGKVLMRDVPVNLESLADPFPYAGPSRYGLASVDGKVLVDPAWDHAEFISPGWVQIWVNERTGLVNRAGQQVLAPEWDSIELLANGLVVAEKDKKRLVFDAKGQELLPKNPVGAEYVDFYGSGFIAKSTKPDGSSLWMLCDPAAGAPAVYDKAARVYWNCDLAENGLLWIEERDTGRWSLIKRDGAPLGVGQDRKPEKWFMPGGFAVLEKEDGTAQHIDAYGKVLGAKTWEEARQFSHGLAAVKTGGKWGFISTDGTMVVPAEWDQARGFVNVGTAEKPFLIACVSRASKWGCIDAGGRVLVELRWDGIGDFLPAGEGHGVAFAVRDGKWGCVDSTGRTVIEPVAAREGTFQSGLLRLAVPEQGFTPYVFFRPDGTKIGYNAPEQKAESEPDPLSAGMRITDSVDGKFGLYDSGGSVVLPSKWDHIAWIGPQVAAAWTADKGGIFDAKGRALFLDNKERRLARFDKPEREGTPSRYQQGLAIIEASPVWGYAKLQHKEQLASTSR